MELNRRLHLRSIEINRGGGGEEGRREGGREGGRVGGDGADVSLTCVCVHIHADAQQIQNRPLPVPRSLRPKQPTPRREEGCEARPPHPKS